MNRFTLAFDSRHGLRLTWIQPGGPGLTNVPVRVRLKGQNTFYVWGGFDSGEGAPAWADPSFDVTLFGPGAQDSCPIEEIRRGSRTIGWRCVAIAPRVEVVLEFAPVGHELRYSLAVRNPRHAGGPSLPLCYAELRFDRLSLGRDTVYTSAHAYGGRTHAAGRLADINPPGLPFHHGTIGLAIPLVYLHDPHRRQGLEFEFMMGQRPTLWLRPATPRGYVDYALTWTPDHLLQPGESHLFPGQAVIRTYAGEPVQQIRTWRDSAEQRYGISATPVPRWARRRSCIELWANRGAYKAFTRLDAPALHAMLKRWRGWGYNAIMVVAPNPTGRHPLSPFHYQPDPKTGGWKAQRTMLRRMHDLGFRAGIWFTTVGLDNQAPPITARRDWWTHRPNLDLFYAWDSNAKTKFTGYAPDGDPCSTGWRQFMLDQARDLLKRGWDGVFIDGCIPRASNHARWFWPGESRNAVEDQVTELAALIRAGRPGALLTNEDSGLGAQATCEITTGRYTPMAPYFKKAFWDHGMGGGPALTGEPPARIPPEMAREYLLIRYASLLPGAMSEDGIEGYCSEEARPWVVQTLLSGPTTLKTHAEYVNDPLTFRQIGDAPPAGERAKDPAWRRQGHEEFLALLKFRERNRLVGIDVPMSIEGVVVTGDKAVIGIVRPTARRCLLILIQFADRPATVEVRLADPIDVPAVQRRMAGAPHRRRWRTRDVLRSIVNEAPAGSAAIGPGRPLTAALGPYGFRVFELTSTR